MAAIAAPGTISPMGLAFTRRPRLSDRAAFVLLASLAFSFLASASAPTPLYGVYQREWHYSPTTTTLVFAVYAASVLGALLTVGRLSDHIGRRPVLMTALGIQVVALALFLSAHSVPVLMAARFVQGMSTGAALGALGAGLLDLSKKYGPTAGAVAPLLGTGVGAVVAGAFVEYLPAPRQTIYAVWLAVFVVQAVGVALAPETVTRAPGALASLRPRFALPPVARGPLRAAAPAMLASWSIAGFYASLGPALVRRITGSDNHVFGGAALFVLAGSAALAVLALRYASPQQLMLVGVVALFAGVGLTLLAGDVSAGGFWLAAVVAGVGFGAAFQGALRSVAMAVGAHERAGVISVLFVVSYVGFGVPAILAGIAVSHTGDIMATAREYGVGVMVLCAVALVALKRTIRTSPAALPIPVQATAADRRAAVAVVAERPAQHAI
jgi:MFS family permease